ncbi:MAG: ATP-dependent sacrificial sulfur transferase LarE [Lachnospiraceae bacterium]|nr:ATP-dependent sacrificial sulfur transferase LarE [Lachnospiraceae bacterium]
MQISEQICEEKLEQLKEYLRQLGSVAIAFSSGVDSTFLLRVAHDTLGENVIAVTAMSCSFPKRELNEAKDFCQKENIRHIVCESEELKIEGFCQNPKNRCYLCKKELFEKIGEIAARNHIEHVAEGSNMDDNGDYRPGLIAVSELGVKSPLRHVELNKEEIRYLSRKLGLPTWDKQSFACLSSRFVYGETITEEKLGMVDQAEQLLLDKGFHQVRVRIHGTIARIEILPEEFEKLMQEEIRSEIMEKFKKYGFTYVTLDLQGYRMGSMNETL